MEGRRGGEERETRELNSRRFKNRREEAVRIKDMRKGYKMEDGSPGRSDEAWCEHFQM